MIRLLDLGCGSKAEFLLFPQSECFTKTEQRQRKQLPHFFHGGRYLSIDKPREMCILGADD